MQLALGRKRSIAVIGLLLVLFILAGFAAPKHADASTGSERHMAYLINNARKANHRASLAFNETLSKYARRHSATMASRNKLYHNPYLAQWLGHINWRILGENVGVGGSISSLHVAFMKSPGHRANILDRRYWQVGVGIVSSGGRLWVTVIFRG